jgi:hypothetical protein
MDSTIYRLSIMEVLHREWFLVLSGLVSIVFVLAVVIRIAIVTIRPKRKPAIVASRQPVKWKRKFAIALALVIATIWGSRAVCVVIVLPSYYVIDASKIAAIRIDVYSIAETADSRYRFVGTHEISDREQICHVVRLLESGKPYVWSRESDVGVSYRITFLTSVQHSSGMRITVATGTTRNPVSYPLMHTLDPSPVGVSISSGWYSNPELGAYLEQVCQSR